MTSPNVQQFIDDAFAQQVAADAADKAKVQADFDAYKTDILTRGGPMGLITTNWVKNPYRGYANDLTGYTEVFRTDFTDLSKISGPTGNGPWYSSVHSGFGGAGWGTLGGTGDPYSIVNGALNIRVQKIGTVWYGGIIQTMKADGTGLSWAVDNGVFYNWRVKLPPALNTQPMYTLGAPQHGHWGSGWLLSAADYHPEITDFKIEIDCFETYGDDKGDHTTCHIKSRGVPQPGDYLYPTGGWRQSDALYTNPQTVKNTWDNAQTFASSVTLGDNQFHDYGLKLEGDWIIRYLDGKSVGRYPLLPQFKTPLYALINHTLYADNVSSIVSPLDMQVASFSVSKKL